MKVLIDADLLESLVTPTVTPALILAGLLSHPMISLYRYADDGPPPEIKARKYGDWTTAYEGWATLGPEEPEMGGRLATCASGDSVLNCGILPRDFIHLAQIADPSIYEELGTDNAAAQREADAIAAQVASSIDADLFITGRKLLHEGHEAFTRDITVLSPEKALPVVSLYLRTQGEFITYRSPDSRSTFRSNKWSFTWVGARELLPASWKWFSSCVAESQSRRDDTLLYLGQSSIQRVQRALIARDTVHSVINQPQDNNTADEILSNLDVIFVLLMGALDATARVAHITLELPSSKNRIRKAGWHVTDWLNTVRAADQSLANIVAEGTPEQNLITIIRLLRNSVHGEASQSLAVSNSGSRTETMFSLPSADMAELITAMEALGGTEKWGVKEMIPGRMHAAPHILLEAILPPAISLLDSIMMQTPVERLPSYNASEVTLAPPSNDPLSPFSENNRKSIRWQLGL
ncbi:hypothetical protein [Amycolatopsis sp. VC5-11]|uniref:hypothetical protein n=1 Tax=Amycolatopsis sp. VC5-11 TaxID=3120156 RepID=UPI003008D0C2